MSTWLLLVWTRFPGPLLTSSRSVFKWPAALCWAFLGKASLMVCQLLFVHSKWNMLIQTHPSLTAASKQHLLFLSSRLKVINKESVGAGWWCSGFDSRSNWVTLTIDDIHVLQFSFYVALGQTNQRCHRAARSCGHESFNKWCLSSEASDSKTCYWCDYLKIWAAVFSL